MGRHEMDSAKRAGLTHGPRSISDGRLLVPGDRSFDRVA